MGGAAKGGGGPAPGTTGYDTTGVVGPEATQSAYVLPQTAEAGAGPDWSGMLRAFGDVNLGGSSMGGIGGGAPALSHVSYEQPPIKVPTLGFALTPSQSRMLQSMGLSGEQGQRFVLQQALNGNPAYGPYTVQQVQAARAQAGGG